MPNARAKGSRKPSAGKADAQLQALRSLAWLYSQSRLWGNPRRFEFTLGDKDASELRNEALRSHIDNREKTESAKKHLLATGYDVPDSWLTVRYVGDLGRTDSAATDNKPEMTVITDSGADLLALDAVLREMYVAGLRLEAKTGQTGDWPGITDQPTVKQDESDFLSLTEVATICHVSKPHISNLCKEGKIECKLDKRGWVSLVSLTSAKACLAKASSKKTARANAKVARDARSDVRALERDKGY